ncbi:hypothetical protein Q5H91_09795 [Sphingomonas sp. KR1UV-12]|uniref:Uncharacterized protein n=1 Tax=Sphingomonas aurea TaxID=3063994 RepID=A0ABT9EKK9_9SPHN|nr:hypothetical protein [Sphingomonas sp. KR1UV-12]MDP1027504.1 hypothetical protein [Sphingomonas sp. KR1UV-12]
MDVRIRRLAGLPASSAEGQVRILDVGHHPSDAMVSIVARHTQKGWAVSYACAESPYCAVDADHDARSYTLSPPDSDQVDGILKDLSAGTQADGVPPSPAFIGGYALVSIDYNGFKRDYRRGSSWGEALGKLRSLLSPPER